MCQTRSVAERSAGRPKNVDRRIGGIHKICVVGTSIYPCGLICYSDLPEACAKSREYY